MAKKILVLVGGISKDSLNQKLFHAIRKLDLKDFEFESFDISKLPFFSKDIESDLPAPVRDLKNKINDCDAALFITPEYNRSIPGVLKNAIDWGSRPQGQNSWANKPAGVMGATPGPMGTFGAQNHLRQVLNALNLHVMNQPDFYMGSVKPDEKGEISDDRSKDFIKKYFNAMKDWLERF